MTCLQVEEVLRDLLHQLFPDVLRVELATKLELNRLVFGNLLLHKLREREGGREGGRERERNETQH